MVQAPVMGAKVGRLGRLAQGSKPRVTGPAVIVVAMIETVQRSAMSVSRHRQTGAVTVRAEISLCNAAQQRPNRVADSRRLEIP